MSRYTRTPLVCKPTAQPEYLNVTFQGARPVRVGTGLFLTVRYGFKIVNDEPVPMHYHIALETRDAKEVIAYHSAHVGHDRAHLHLGEGSGVTHSQLRAAHLPTGVCDWEMILALLEAFGCRPVRQRGSSRRSNR